MKGSSKVFVTGCFLAGFVLSLVMGRVGLQAWNEYAHTRACECKLQAYVSEIQSNLNAEDRYLRSLLTDTRCSERVARKRLGYVRKGEWVFHFSQEDSK